VSEVFIAATKQGPDDICPCCHRRMYRGTVQQFYISKYCKESSEVFLPRLMHASVKRKICICNACDCALKQGEMPAQAEVNNLDLFDIPTELVDQNPFEIWLIAQRLISHVYS